MLLNHELLHRCSPDIRVILALGMTHLIKPVADEPQVGGGYNKISSVKYNYMINKYNFLSFFSFLIKLALQIVPVS